MRRRLLVQALCFGQEHGLDFQRLLGASVYKEAYRRDMIRWGEEKRQADPGFFCRKVVEGVSQPVWVSGLGGSLWTLAFSIRVFTGFPSCRVSPTVLAPALASVLVPYSPLTTQQPEWPPRNNPRQVTALLRTFVCRSVEPP